MKQLTTKQYRATGTIRFNRVPNRPFGKKKELMKKASGFMAATTDENNDIASCLWKDNNMLLLLLIILPFPRDGGMVEDHGAPEAGQLHRVWTEVVGRQRVTKSL